MLTPWLQQWQGHPAHVVRDAGMFLCAVAVLSSVAFSFLNYHRRRTVAHGQRSLVATSTMLLFYAGFCLLIGRRIGALTPASGTVEGVAITLGLAVVVAGAIFNIAGRFQLGATWSDQIAIYADHQMLADGLYGFVRHPLYASTIWMFLGAALAWLNWAALLATLVVFIPAMRYRADQEEQLLQATFPGYQAYRERTGRFFPKCSTSK